MNWQRVVAPAIGISLMACAASHPPAKRYEVEIRGLVFVPATLEVAEGDTVVWINHDLVPHTATSTAKPGWTTGTIAQGDSGIYVASLKGEAPYACEFHPTMVGKVIVK